MNTIEENAAQPSWLPHVIELRKRLLRILFIFLVVFLALYPFANQLYSLIAKPLLNDTFQQTHIIATTITATFTVPLKLTMVVAVFLLIPYFFFEIWAFVAPALYRHEKKMILLPILCGVLLFYLGSLFCYTIVLPMTLLFFQKMAPPDIAMMTDMNHYLDFVLSMLLSFGFAFQIPLVIHALIRTGMVSKENFKKMRRYVIVAAFVLGMVLTPPDVISQIMLAIPLWGLFELGLLLTRAPKKNC